MTRRESDSPKPVSPTSAHGRPTKAVDHYFNYDEVHRLNKLLHCPIPDDLSATQAGYLQNQLNQTYMRTLATSNVVAAVDRWVLHKAPPGSHTATLVFNQPVQRAFQTADLENRRAMQENVKWIYNTLPRGFRNKDRSHDE